jgi:asparagine synthase (glutamine-hydrolysing)
LQSVVGLAAGNSVADRIDRGLMMVAGDLPERYRLNLSIIKPQEKRAWYGPVLRSKIRQPSFAGDPHWHPGMDELNWMSRHDQQNYLPDCLMVKMDVAAMASSLEVRSPLLDYRIVEFAANVPSRLKRSGSTGKLLLKEVAESFLPDVIINRRKTGFGLPVGQWLRTELRHLLDAYLLDDVARRRGLFEASAVQQIVNDHTNGRRDWSSRLWALLMLEMWFREFID